MRYDRTARHVARGIDHFQPVTYLGGGAEFVSSDRTYLRARDLGLVDMGQPSLTRKMQAEDGSTGISSFMLPRLLLSPLLKANAPEKITIEKMRGQHGGDRELQRGT